MLNTLCSIRGSCYRELVNDEKARMLGFQRMMLVEARQKIDASNPK